MLKISGLKAVVEGMEILKGIDLEVKPGEVHGIMGPNGSGKSTLARVLSGDPTYAVTGGEVDYCGQDLLAMAPDERARTGLFLAFQYPVEVPGVTIGNFLRTAFNSRREEELSAMEFYGLLLNKVRELGLADQWVNRYLNEGFSGGEKKRNEILQMMVLEPQLCILDETDSGLDVDALKIVSEGVNKMRSPERSIIIVTHYERLLEYIVPDKCHIMLEGRIVLSEDGIDLARRIDEQGYEHVKQQYAAQTQA
ncbi:Fe-S cluster assembly ATPase SufC [bacterium]|nr:Fe-S cluster assembly ATPase SufC [bacterium]